ncbi:MAG: hypothetical protein KGJ23_16460 [Euryarchaeota archaeon]|nr:hypothetical protein [Euryarchaeota archaeon]
MPAISTAPETTYPTASLAPTLGLWRDSHVLERTWRAPLLVGRGDLLAAQELEVRAALDHDGRAVLSIVGPRGSGTSSIAECAVATFSERFFGRRAPLVLRVDTTQCRTPGLLVKALFHQVDPAIQLGGASTEFLSMLLLRRLRTLARPAVVWLDQVHSTGELGRVAWALARPQEVLPEGTDGLPPLLLVASGSREVIPEAADTVRVAVPPLQGADLLEALRARAALAFQTPPLPEVLRAWADLTVASGWGLAIMGDLLAEAGARAEARGSFRVELQDVALPSSLPRHGQDAEGFGQTILEVLRTATGSLTAGELRRRVTEACASSGMRAPTQARLWRHVVGLERKGVLHRDLRMGGAGGTQALIWLAEKVSRELPSPPREA